jgi:hypothetical protein
MAYDSSYTPHNIAAVICEVVASGKKMTVHDVKDAVRPHQSSDDTYLIRNTLDMAVNIGYLVDVTDKENDRWAYFEAADLPPGSPLRQELDLMRLYYEAWKALYHGEGTADAR